MLKYLKLSHHFNSAGIRQELEQWSVADWQLHYQIKHYEGDWSAIPLRSIKGSPTNIIISPHENEIYEDTAFLRNSTLLQETLSFFQCPLLAVRLMKLNAGAFIKEHRDADLAYEKGEVRLHIPILTDPGVEFILDGESLPLQEGDCWYMNFNLPHSVRNNSPVDRIHLVIDARVNDFIHQLFSGNEVSLRKEIPDTAAAHDEATKKQMIRLFREMNTETSNRMADELEQTMHDIPSHR